MTQIPPIRVAVLDLYNNTPNQGMRCIKELLTDFDGRVQGIPLTFDIYETRYTGETPDLSYDLYISSGGPGSPFDGEGTPWEAAYFGWLERAWNHNQRAKGDRKHVLFICHSFQMMCRFFDIAMVTERRSESFGIFPIHQTPAGAQDPLFVDLPNPFYAADFRHWQVVQPNIAKSEALGTEVLALEKIRPHVSLERAIMAIRLSAEMVGVQFHPEADPPGMRLHFSMPERRAHIVRKHGEEKYRRIIHRLEDDNFLKATHDRVIPNFLTQAITDLRAHAEPHL